ncbi:flavodoxin [Mycobacterium sp. E2989]|uniref:flavodoxin family protein n=1 Tax=Mycobacterium sp. E2989 TaxID=1834140 RepID=UPI00080200A4|nr:flavodoxin [Mycobacterium sp. E2989]OBH82984.1 flavodoxin [Mycobacterium sp. E2989]
MTEISIDGHGPRRRVLLLYYTFTGQTLAVLDAAAGVFGERGWEVHRAPITFTDRRYAERFSLFPLRHAALDLLSVLPAQLRRATGEIQTPDEVRDASYDLICIGSSTWWFTMNMPMRTFLKSDEARILLAGKPFAAFCVCRRYWRGNFAAVRRLGERLGGRYAGGVHFEYLGGQIASGLSLMSYLRSGRYRNRYFGLRIPATNVQPYQLEQTRIFARSLADRLAADAVAS